MAAKKINVLVYSGPGSTAGSVRHCMYTLRQLLSPNYAVIPITETTILKEPWTGSCALLVFPGGADLGYCRVLNGEGNARISQYVRRGGAYLGFCAGGYYGSQRCEFEVGDKVMEVIGKRELAFFPGTCRGCAFKGFVYDSEAGAKAVDIKLEANFVNPKAQALKSYYNGGGVFVDAEKLKDKGVEVLAKYGDKLDIEGGTAAVVYCKVGDGGAILTGPHPEFAAINLDRKRSVEYGKLVDAVQTSENERFKFLEACLTKLGLSIPEERKDSVPSLSRLYLTSLNHIEVSELAEDLQDIISVEDGDEFIRGVDIFKLVKEDSESSTVPTQSLGTLSLVGESEKSATKADQGDVNFNSSLDYNKMIKEIVLREESWPTNEAPYWNHHSFYSHLRRYQDEDAEKFGKLLLYGEVVTSTNTLLEKNTKLLSHLPTGFTAVATKQVAGRGRGSNVWVTPPGSLVFSTVIKHPMHLTATAPVQFIQYLAAMAIVEGIHSYGSGYDVLPVRLKWPNDVYAEDPTSGKGGKKKDFVKIGGILVNSSYSSGNYDLVVGIGLNATNVAPTTSLNALVDAIKPSLTSTSPSLMPFKLEKLLASILTVFERIYFRFLLKGWDRIFEEQYYKQWLHTEQIVTLEMEGGTRARIRGISRDFGMLRVEELGWEDRPTGKTWELHSDGNSFDFFKGLLRRKV